MGIITEDGPAGVDADKLISPVAEDTPELSVAGDDGTPEEALETAPEGKEVLEPEVSLEAVLDASTELLGPSPPDVAEPEDGGIVALLLCGSELPELTTSEELDTCDDEVFSTELGLVVPEDGGFVVVGCDLGQS